MISKQTRQQPEISLKTANRRWEISMFAKVCLSLNASSQFFKCELQAETHRQVSAGIKQSGGKSAVISAASPASAPKTVINLRLHVTLARKNE